MIIIRLPVGPFLLPAVVSHRTYFHSDTATMDAVSQRVLNYLTEVEEAAEDVLTSKQQVSEYLVGNTSLCVIDRKKWCISANSTEVSS